MAAKKKDPFKKIDQSDPYGVKQQQSRADVPPPSAAPQTPKPSDPVSKPPISNNSGGSGATKKELRVDRDESGKITRVELPDGRSFSGLKDSEYTRIVDAYNGSSKAKASKLATPQTEQEQFQAAYDLEQRKKAFEASQLIPNATPEQLASVGNFDVEGFRNQDLNDPRFTASATEQSILNNQRLRDKFTTSGPVSPNKISDLLLSLGDKVVPGSKNALLGQIDSYPKLKAYLQDYSNKDNFKSVQTDVDLAKSNIKFAIALANQPGNSELAIETYDKAVAQLLISERALKQLEKDPKAYVDSVKIERQKLQNEIDKIDEYNLRMRNALIKPNPNYYDNDVNERINNG